MSSYSAAKQKSTPSPSLVPQLVVALVTGVALFFITLVVISFVFNLTYAGKVFPGVSVGGVDLSTLTPKEAAARLSQKLTYPQTGRIAFKEGETFYVAKPQDLGLYLDPQTSALAAYSTGRQGNPITRALVQLRAWYTGEDIAPLMVYDARQAREYLQGIAAEIDQPVVEASLDINGVEVVAQPGQVGRTLDIQATMAPLEAQMRSMKDSLFPLMVTETPPAILDVTHQADLARQILSEPLVLRLPDPQEGDPGPWTFEPKQLAPMLTIERLENEDGALYQVGLNTEGLREFLADLAPQLSRTPSNARFVFNDETRQLDLIQNAVIGRSLDVEASVQVINEQLVEGQHDIPLVVNVSEPEVMDTATAADLGITELVSEQSTYFYGSSSSRIQNIKTAASRFHGVLVPPGATFSMADVMGDVSLDTGYEEAWIIYGNRTIKGVGGGVCQVSTTLFRTVFFGGFPVVERYPHAYRVGYYEQNAAGSHNTRMAGLDATVYVPVVDFKFTNDTPNWLLMETYTNVQGRSLTWKFYSTSDGRSMDWDTSGLQNVEDPPEPLYQENPDLAKGEINQVDWAVEGADVSVDRTVYRQGEVYFEDSFITHYMPWRAIFEYGPGTKIPDQNEN